MINYAELITALQGCELLPEQARQLERVLQEHGWYKMALAHIASPDDSGCKTAKDYAFLAGHVIGYASTTLEMNHE